MTSKKKREEKKQERRRKQQAWNPDIPGKLQIIKTPAGKERMSELLLELVDPYAPLAPTEQGFRKLLTLGMAAWNVACYTGSKREEFLRDIANTFPADVREEFGSIFESMIRRKETLFPEVTRMMLSYDLTMTADGPHVQVMSTLDSV